ncbi:MAG: hypothetical protein IT449_11790 [Phycisphaerales bacterium]|nr:hypothetical protein [Phycisphaerales bacterium]
MSSMPPVPPAFQPPAYQAMGSQPLSGAAVAALVSALVFPCVGLHVVVSLICSAVGIAATSGGKARGRGLAIVAIPIALVLGALEAGGFYWFGKMTVAVLDQSMAAGRLLESPSEDLDARADAFYDARMTDDFKATVSKDQFKSWAKQVVEKHGRATMVDPSGLQNSAPAMGSSQPRFTMNLRAKFVNGEETIATDLFVAGKSVLKVTFLIDDVAVGDLSARSLGTPKDDKTEAGKPDAEKSDGGAAGIP